MRSHSVLKSQDILILLKMVTYDEAPWKQQDLARTLGLSQAEIAFGLDRLKRAGLVDATKKKPLRLAMLEFIVHGLKYIYPAQIGGQCRGMPTANSALPLSKKIRASDDMTYVWPSDTGTVRGQALDPIYKSVPEAAVLDPELYQMLALIDAIRVGRSRERKIAITELEKRIAKGDPS